MSWLRPEGVQPSDYDPETRVHDFFQEYPESGERVLKSFTEVDPFQVFFGNNPDEYLGYAKRFMNALEGKDLGALSEQEVVGLIRNAFHVSQIEQGLVQEKNIEDIAKKIRE